MTTDIRSDGSELDSAPRPNLAGRHVELRAIAQSDYGWIWELFTHPQLGYRWRPNPGSLNPDQLASQIWQGILSQFLIVHRGTQDRLGVVVAYQPNAAHRIAHVAIVLDPGIRRLGWPLEGFNLFMDCLFDSYDLRKVYAEVTDFNLSQYRSLLKSGKAAEEGCFRQHVYVGGAYRDVHVLAFYREKWHRRSLTNDGTG